VTDIRYSSSRPRFEAHEYADYWANVLVHKDPPKVFFVVEGESDRKTIEEIGKRIVSPELMNSVEIRVPYEPGKLGVDEEVVGIARAVGGRAPVQGIIDRDADILTRVQNSHLIALTDYWDFESTLFLGSTSSKRLVILETAEERRDSLIEDAMRELPLVGAMRRLSQDRDLNLKFRDPSSESGASIIGNYLISETTDDTTKFSIDQLGLASQLVRGNYRTDAGELLKSARALLAGSDWRTLIHGKDLIGFLYAAWKKLDREGLAARPPSSDDYMGRFRKCFAASIAEDELNGLEIGSLILDLLK